MTAADSFESSSTLISKYQVVNEKSAIFISSKFITIFPICETTVEKLGRLSKSYSEHQPYNPLKH